MALDFSKLKKLSIAGIELRKLLINGIQVWTGVTDWIANSINTDGTPFRGTNGEIGYISGKAISTTGVLSDAKTSSVTGFIPCAPKEKMYISKGLMEPDELLRKCIVLYTSDFTCLGRVDVKAMLRDSAASQLINEGLSFYDDNTLHTVTPYCLRWWLKSATVNQTAYVRFGIALPMPDDACITKNEPI